jgi:hypothetical protein
MSIQVSNFRTQFFDHFPQDTMEKALQGACASAAIRVITGASGKAALRGAGLSGIATLVNSTVLALIKTVFHNNPIMVLCTTCAHVFTFWPWIDSIDKSLDGKTTSGSILKLITFFVLNPSLFSTRQTATAHVL